jgi:hypothetical protein
MRGDGYCGGGRGGRARADLYGAVDQHDRAADHVAGWLQGEAVTLRKPLPLAGAMVDGAAMEQYLGATDYFAENPGNLPHTVQSAAGGALLLNG